MPGTVHIKADDPQVEKDVNRYYEQCRKDGKNSKEYCARVAWNILCANKSPDYPGCTGYGKNWGEPYSAPTGEGVEECPCRKKFKTLMASIREDKNLEPDGSIRRDEFDVYPRSMMDEMTPETRVSLERFVIENTPIFLKFQNVKSQDVITYGDRRGRAVVVPVVEMTDEELLWLALEKGWSPVAKQAMVPPVASESESLRHKVNSEFDRALQSIEEVKAVGKPQTEVLAMLQAAKGEWVPTRSIETIPSLRGVHYGKIMSAVEQLAKKGMIDWEGKWTEAGKIRVKRQTESADPQNMADALAQEMIDGSANVVHMVDYKRFIPELSKLIMKYLKK